MSERHFEKIFALKGGDDKKKQKGSRVRKTFTIRFCLYLILSLSSFY